MVFFTEQSFLILIQLNLPIFYIMYHAFGCIQKLTKVTQIYYLKFYNFVFHIYVYIHLGLIFAYGLPIVPGFDEKTILSSLDYIFPFVKEQLTVSVWIY